MNDSDPEQTLSRFKLKAPRPEARTRILAAAHEAWAQPAPAEPAFRAWNQWRSIGWLAAAASVLLLLNGLVTLLDQRWTATLIADQTPTYDDTPTDLEETCLEMGYDPVLVRRVRMLAALSVPDRNISEELRQRNLLLQRQL